MAKKKETVAKEKSANIFDEIAKQTGGELVSAIKNVPYFIDTGNLAINWQCSNRMIGGGVPGSRITEIYGPSASGKSLFASNIVSGCQSIGGYAIYLDVENSINPEWMNRVSGVDISKLIRYSLRSIPTLESAFHKIYKVIEAIRERDKTSPICVIYDSISASPCERELTEVQLPDNFTETQFRAIVKRHEMPGERAKVISKEMRKLNPVLEKHDATCVLINQVRLGGFGSYTGPVETTPGGKAIEFYSSLRLRTQGKKRIDNKKLGSISGVNVQVKNTKNRTCAPFRVVENVKLLFSEGINPVSGLLLALLQAERIVSPKPGYYSVNPQYLPAGKENCNFRANKEEGLVPMEVLLECPKLLDVETTKEVTDYLSRFGDFETIFDDEDLIQTDMDDDGSESESPSLIDQLTEETEE